MKIIIVGAGLTGIELARRLIHDKNDVVLIDNNPEIVGHISNRLDCMVLESDGNSLENLKEAGLEKADALVVLTNSDEVNMITCSLVDSVYPEITKIARVRNPEYHLNKKNILTQHASSFSGKNRPLYGIDYMVYPDMEAANAVVQAVEHGAVTDVISFDNSEYEIMRVTVEKGSRLDGLQVQDLRSLIDKPFLLVYLEQGEQASLPIGSTVIHGDDCLGILAKRTHMKEFLELCGSQIIQLKKIALVGAGHVGTIIADRLIETPQKNKMHRFLRQMHKSSQEFIIIDKNAQRAQAAAERFSNISVYRGDITDESFIAEENLSAFDLIISATHNHELNMVVAAYMKSIGVKKTISLVSSGGFAEIARNIGVDVAVPIKDTVVDTIIGHLRGKSVTGVHTISDGDLEIIEYVLPATSSLSGKTLKEVANPGTFLIMLIKKQDSEEFLIPTGNTELKEGDHLVIICNVDKNAQVLEYFGGKGE